MSADIGSVTFVSVSPVLGGGELTVLRMALALSRDVRVRIVGGASDPLLERARRAGVPTSELAIGSKLGRRTAVSNLIRYPWARRALHHAVIDATTDGWCVLQYKWEELLWGGEEASERVALWEHGPIPAPLLRVPWVRDRLRRAFASASALFAWSAPASTSIADICRRDAVRLEHGVDGEAARRAAEMRSQLRAGLGLPAGVQLLAFVGRVVADKGVVELTEALEDMPYAHLVICGEGPASARVRDTAARIGASARLHMVGHVDTPLDVLAAADVMVLLTRSPGEGRPISVIESLAVGTPVLGAGASPALRALAHRDGVSLLDDCSSPRIANAVRQILGRPRPQAVIPAWSSAANRFLHGLRAASGAKTPDTPLS